jgi:hypothetical protein
MTLVEMKAALRAASNPSAFVYSLSPADLATLTQAVRARDAEIYRAAKLALTSHVDDPAPEFAQMRRAVEGFGNFLSICNSLRQADKEAAADGIDVELETAAARLKRRTRNMLREHRRTGTHGKLEACPECLWAIELLVAA